MTTLKLFRNVAWLEGISFIVLLGIAMPLKYYAGMPMAVRVVGMLHGLLFITYAILVGRLWLDQQWTLKRAALAMLASLLPFGTFVFDRSLQRELAAQ